MENYVDFAVQKAVELLAIDSPTGYTAEAEEFVLREFRRSALRRSGRPRAAFSSISAAKAQMTPCCSRPTPIRSAAWSPRSRATAACAS